MLAAVDDRLCFAGYVGGAARARYDPSVMRRVLLYMLELLKLIRCMLQAGRFCWLALKVLDVERGCAMFPDLCMRQCTALSFLVSSFRSSRLFGQINNGLLLFSSWRCAKV